MSDTAQIIGNALIFFCIIASILYSNRKDVSNTVFYMGLALLVGTVIF